MIDDLLKADMLEVLRANDQLKRERKLGKVFMVSTASLDGMSSQLSMQAAHQLHTPPPLGNARPLQNPPPPPSPMLHDSLSPFLSCDLCHFLTVFVLLVMGRL